MATPPIIPVTITRVKLVDWAERQGISYRTAIRWYHDGKIPGAYQTDTGRILVPVTPNECKGACCAEIHVECLVTKLTEAGYVIERRPGDAPGQSSSASGGP